MNKVLNVLNFTLAYLDDIIIFSETAEQHLKHIQIVLDRLSQAELKLKKSKCAFFKKELHYLGNLLTTDGGKPQFEKIKACIQPLPVRKLLAVHLRDISSAPLNSTYTVHSIKGVTCKAGE